MINPFQKRATELYKDVEAFLPLVSPDPIRFFLLQRGSSGSLLDRLVVIIGTPGSGKTTIARLFEYPTLHSISTNESTYGPLLKVMQECGAVMDVTPCVLGCRLPLETDYRNIWELEYPPELKQGLTTTLIQSRAVLAWIRNLRAVGIGINEIEIAPREEAEGAVALIGGVTGVGMLEKARQVEHALYKIVTALVPKTIEELDDISTGGYRPFDVIDYFVITANSSEGNQRVQLRPLVALDDAHLLHADQYKHVHYWLAKRELRVARWILTRLDVLTPRDSLKTRDDNGPEADLPGITKHRDIVEISIQGNIVSSDSRTQQRREFRKMAKDMSDRYIRTMPLFQNRSLSSLSNLLSHIPKPIAASKCRKLQDTVENDVADLRISRKIYGDVLARVEGYLSKHHDNNEDVRLAMARILLHRGAGKDGQRLLFVVDDILADIPVPDASVDSGSTDKLASVYQGARLHLLHQYDRPFYYGFDDLSDASSDNVEQFLRLASELVETAQAQMIRSSSPEISSTSQHKSLREMASKILSDWDFPECNAVKTLTNKIAEVCRDESLRPTAPLGAGANAIGIPQEEFETLADTYQEMARVLHFAIAYNALALVPRYTCKGKEWCLFELGGTVILRHGLTLQRGGFVRMSAKQVSNWLAKGATNV